MNISFCFDLNGFGVFIKQFPFSSDSIEKLAFISLAGLIELDSKAMFKIFFKGTCARLQKRIP